MMGTFENARPLLGFSNSEIEVINAIRKTLTEANITWTTNYKCAIGLLEFIDKIQARMKHAEGLDLELVNFQRAFAQAEKVIHDKDKQIGELDRLNRIYYDQLSMLADDLETLRRGVQSAQQEAELARMTLMHMGSPLGTYREEDAEMTFMGLTFGEVVQVVMAHKATEGK